MNIENINLFHGPVKNMKVIAVGVFIFAFS